jgi:hypothetical protein
MAPPCFCINSSYQERNTPLQETQKVPNTKKPMSRLTQAAYDTLEDEITRNPPDVDPAKSRHPVRMVVVDDFSAEWLRVKAEAGHTTPTKIIHTLVLHELTGAEA